MNGVNLMGNIKVMFFDLFFTLITPCYLKLSKLAKRVSHS